MPVELNSHAISPSISPQPPPVFKSNKVSPLDDNVSDDQEGIINDICETIDEAMFSIEAADTSDDDGSKGSGHTDVSCITGVYVVQSDHDKMTNNQSNGSIKVDPVSRWDEKA